MIGGHDIVSDPLASKRRIAFVGDEPHLFDHLTVAEHLRLSGRIYGVADVDARIGTWLKELELAGRDTALPGELSRGMKQKVALACALIHDPQALVLDEPLTGLDPLGIHRMKQTIVANAGRGVSGSYPTPSARACHGGSLCLLPPACPRTWRYQHPRPS